MSLTGQPNVVARPLRTPRAAASAGIIFAVILAVVLVVLRTALPGAHPSAWFYDAAHRQQMSTALQLIPFAGIAFLWFIGVIRSRLGDQEDKLFATVFLGSGLLFVGTLFTATAVLGGLLRLFDGPAAVPVSAVALATGISSVLVGTVAIRFAAIFTFVVTNLGRRTSVVPRWLVVLGYIVALLLLVTPPGTAWVPLFFPGWVFVFSAHVFVASFSPAGAAQGDGSAQSA